MPSLLASEEQATLQANDISFILVGTGKDAERSKSHEPNIGDDEPARIFRGREP